MIREYLLRQMTDEQRQEALETELRWEIRYILFLDFMNSQPMKLLALVLVWVLIFSVE